MVPTMAGQMPIQHSIVGQSMQHTFANGGSEAEFGPLKDSEAGFDPLKVPITLLLVPPPHLGHIYIMASRALPMAGAVSRTELAGIRDKMPQGDLLGEQTGLHSCWICFG